MQTPVAGLVSSYREESHTKVRQCHRNMGAARHMPQKPSKAIRRGRLHPSMQIPMKKNVETNCQVSSTCKHLNGTSFLWIFLYSKWQRNPRPVLFLTVFTRARKWLDPSHYNSICLLRNQHLNTNPWPLVRKRTVPTDDRHLLAKFSANFCG
jgi:hypothetical protein